MRIFVTGAAGIVGNVLVPHLALRAEVIALDLRPSPMEVAGVRWVEGSVADGPTVRNASNGCDAVVHLATGQHRGWSGLRDAEIEGTRLVLEAARETGVHRVILASSNHVAGGLELDRFAKLPGAHDVVAAPDDPIRPDSPYGAAKAFVEAYGRYVAETSSVCVSCLRVGTVMSIDDPEQYVDADEFASIPGGPDAVRRRLASTWLTHGDLRLAIDQELTARERFRLRFLTSAVSGFWSRDLLVWDEAR